MTGAEEPRGARLRGQGIALFSFIPLVLYLYLQLPLGAGPSLALGFALMIGHRFIAAPWAARHAEERCLWCGRAGSFDRRLEVETRAETWRLAACSAAHAERSARFLTFVERHRGWIALGIFAPLALLLGNTLALALGRPFLEHELARTIFRATVALTVVVTSLAWFATPPARRLRCPFPLHNLCLLGIGNLLWIFRLVGVWWLALAALAILGGLGQPSPIT